MTYLLFTVAAFMAIITAFILNSMSGTGKYSVLKKALVITLSVLIFIALAFYLLQQKSY